MTFISDLSQDYVLDDSMLVDETPHGMSTGYEERDWSSAPFGAGFAKPFDLEIPDLSKRGVRQEIAERVEEMEKKETRLSDIANFYNLPPKNQGRTNFCWANGPTHCVEIQRLVQGNSLTLLSPASIACPITGYRNVGGWGEKALQYIAEHGLCTEETWPATAISRQYDTDRSRKERERYQADEWYDLDPRKDLFAQMVKCALDRIPFTIAHPWWGHLVTGYDVVVMDGLRLGLRERNSWGVTYGKNGFFVLPEGTGRNTCQASESVAFRGVTAS